jgi:hypothetical protein
MDAMQIVWEGVDWMYLALGRTGLRSTQTSKSYFTVDSKWPYLMRISKT